MRESRRKFVFGGLVTAAILGPLAAARVATKAVRDLWGPTRPTLVQSEVSQWEHLVGARFQIAGEAGKAPAILSAVVYGAADPDRPADLARSLPFTAYFEMDARVAPAGQATYHAVHPLQGATQVFLGRGEDRGGKGILYAIFN